MSEQSETQTSGCTFETSLGRLGLAWNLVGVVRLRLPEQDPARLVRRMLELHRLVPHDELPDVIVDAIALLTRYAAGIETDLTPIPIDLGMRGDAVMRIYSAARTIRWGETVTYGELARRIGKPGLARAVGQAMGSNPVPLLIPCHRVLAAGGRIGGFSAPGGPATKERLLALEGWIAAPAPPLLEIMERPEAK